MYCILDIFIIFCFISTLNAVSLKIDGMIDLGPNWSYEYKIAGPSADQNAKHEIARHGKHRVPDLNFAERLEEDEERELNAEKPRKEERLHKLIFHKHHRKAKTTTTTTTTTEKPITTTETTSAKRPTTTAKDDDDERAGKPRPTFSSQSEHGSSSLDSSEEKTTPKQNTMFDMYDFTTTRKPRTNPTRPSTTPKKERKKKHNDANDDKEIARVQERGPVNEDAASFESVSGKKTVKRGHLGPGKGNATNPDAKTSPTPPNITEVTTLRTADIFSEPHKVKDDAKINDFTNHIYKQTLKVFDAIKQKTNQYHLKKEVDVLARSYEVKFRDFLKETKQQKIKTRLGTQKVVLNTIEMSNRILKRLINFMIGDMDKKGVLRNNVATANIFQQEVEKEQVLELTHACKKFGICRAGTNGFPDFLIDILGLMLQSDDRKLQHCIDAFTETVKNSDFNKILSPQVDKKLKETIDNIEKYHISTLRPVIMILKNIIANKNKPIVVNTIAASSTINSTLAFLEIIDLLDQNLPKNEANLLEWSDLKSSLGEFTQGKRFDVQEIMESFLKHMKKAVKAMDANTQKIVCKNLMTIIA